MVEHRHDVEAKGTWVTYRPEIKVLDCTIRDGGLINNHMWEDGFVEAVYQTLVAAGVDYMEVGYKGSKSIYGKDQYGAWKHCDEDDLRRVIGDNPSGLKLSAMADAEKSDYKQDILPKDQSIIDLIRVACYIHQIPTALDMVKDAHDKGYEVALQLMAVSVVQDRDLIEALKVIPEQPISCLYLVDSFGALYSEQVRDYVHIYMKALEGTGIEVGMHAHNNQQLAYANTIEACIVGANRLDGTINGMGRGAGNCPLELLIGFLKNPKFHLRPVLECIEKYCFPLRDKMEWGYHLPYMLTGQLNRHPRSAIAMRAGDNPDGIVKFYDQLLEED
ncbi:MAG TPA: aldolase catalytic domain-containing protein [Planctomycetota bacterium]|nr:aldolase catalytic domain-containing protein [Planctomycetota bacterium]